MSALNWDELPPAVIRAIENHLGPVKQPTPTPGVSGGLSAVIQDKDGNNRLIKTAPDGTAAHRACLRERTAHARFPATVPAPRIQDASVPGWAVLLFDVPDWRPASLAPGSADLEPVTAALNELGYARADGLPPVAGHTGALKARALSMLDRMPDDGDFALYRLLLRDLDDGVLEGNRLACCGLGPGNLRITSDGNAAVTSLGRACAAAPFFDAAVLVPWLIAEGHAPAEAEKALSGLFTFEAANEQPDTSDTITALSILWMLHYRYKSGFGQAAVRESWARAAAACRSWAAYRADRA